MLLLHPRKHLVKNFLSALQHLVILKQLAAPRIPHLLTSQSGMALSLKLLDDFLAVADVTLELITSVLKHVMFWLRACSGYDGVLQRHSGLTIFSNANRAAGPASLRGSGSSCQATLGSSQIHEANPSLVKEALQPNLLCWFAAVGPLGVGLGRGVAFFAGLPCFDFFGVKALSVSFRGVDISLIESVRCDLASFAGLGLSGVAEGFAGDRSFSGLLIELMLKLAIGRCFVAIDRRTHRLASLQKVISASHSRCLHGHRLTAPVQDACAGEIRCEKFDRARVRCFREALLILWRSVGSCCPHGFNAAKNRSEIHGQLLVFIEAGT
ncbi:hypothetical protein KC363_g229 [Hortaea werneckii]|nr:hypothetical protein KC363_g229 [Hortaea werneckii]